MNENLKKELVQLEREVLAAAGHSLNESTQHKNQRYAAEYFADYQNNLFDKMSEAHRAQYELGNGDELSDKKSPAKMKSIFSSSAMTYNMLGNDEIRAKDNNGIFAPGAYKIEYEKKTLHRQKQKKFSGSFGCISAERGERDFLRNEND